MLSSTALAGAAKALSIGRRPGDEANQPTAEKVRICTRCGVWGNQVWGNQVWGNQPCAIWLRVI
jgi:hypothetical protein